LRYRGKHTKKNTDRTNTGQDVKSDLGAKGKSTRANERKKKLGMIVAVVIIIVFAVIGNSLFKIYKLEKERSEKESQLSSLEDKESDLIKELETVESDEYIEQEARWRLGMIRRGEIRYIIRHDGRDAGSDQEKDAHENTGGRLDD